MYTFIMTENRRGILRSRNTFPPTLSWCKMYTWQNGRYTKKIASDIWENLSPRSTSIEITVKSAIEGMEGSKNDERK